MLGSDSGHFVFAAGCNRTTMLLMRGRIVPLPIAVAVALTFPPLLLFSQTPDLEQHLRDQYQGKTLVVRGFYSGDKLRYSASGELVGAAPPGDWTESAFVTIDQVHVSDDRITIEARRLLVIMRDREFHFRPAERKRLVETKSQPLKVSIEVDMEMHNPADNLVDAAFLKVFLNPQDQLATLVPEYWTNCVSQGLTGKNLNCRFSSEVSAVPGVASVGSDSDATSPLSTPSLDSAGAGMNSNAPIHGIFHVGGGVRPPRVLSQPEPEFSESARAVKYQGTTTLGLIVDEQGHPRNIYIMNPLGGGLDANAVRAVKNWKFQPAEKEGQSVPVVIAVEVDFHLY